jgi:UDP-N-acetylglucosamine 2-epimerase (non-hydrolysing)
MKIATIVGARPQFIKAAIVSQQLCRCHQEILIHTGQHYDYELSLVFFQDLDLPEPHYNLDVGSGSHGFQTGHGILRLEPLLVQEKPDLVLLYGDTNATLAGAVAAAKLAVPVAHVEAGIRHYDKAVPEEINRVVTDHLSELLFCPTQNSVAALEREGIASGAHLVGDVMLDSVQAHKHIAAQKSQVLHDLNLRPHDFYLATVHRPVNTDNPSRLSGIFSAFNGLDRLVVLPLHPRTRRRLQEYGLWSEVESFDNIRIIKPVGYLDFLMLEQHAQLIITDSGGVQREAYFLGIPCVTLQTQCPWPETVRDGWNVLIEPQCDVIVQTVTRFQRPGNIGQAFGDGTASEKISEIITNWA